MNKEKLQDAEILSLEKRIQTLERDTVWLYAQDVGLILLIMLIVFFR